MLENRVTVTLDQKIAAVDRLLQDLRWARGRTDVLEGETHAALVAISAELHAEQPETIGRVLAAMTDQVDRARQGKARHGQFEIGHCQTLAEGLCGRWWPTVARALRQFEQQGERV